MENLYNYLYILFGLAGTFLLTIYGNDKYKKKRLILLWCGIALILLASLSNSLKENIVAKINDSQNDTLRQDNRRLLEALSYNKEDTELKYEEILHMYEKYSKPNIKVTEPKILSLKPIIYIEKFSDKTNDFPQVDKFGLFFIAKIQNGSIPKSINGLKIKCQLKLDYFLFSSIDQISLGKSGSEIKRALKDKKPYIIIDWDAYTLKKSTVNYLYPNQLAYIGFMLIEPTINTQWHLNYFQYLGYGDKSLNPAKKMTIPEFALFFSDLYTSPFPKTIRPDLNFFIVLDSKEYLIQKENIMFVDRVNEYEWQNDSFEKMFLRYFAE